MDSAVKVESAASRWRGRKGRKGGTSCSGGVVTCRDEGGGVERAPGVMQVAGELIGR